MTPGNLDAHGLATLAGQMDRSGLRERTYPPREPVPFQDYATLRAASARSSEIILQLAKRLALYEPEDTIQRAAEAHRRYLQSLGCKS